MFNIIPTSLPTSESEPYKEFDKIMAYLIACLKQDREKKSHTIPWYLLMGDKDSGKTTLLKKSSLVFPFISNPENSSPQGTGWLSEEAVFIEIDGERISIPHDDFLPHLAKQCQYHHVIPQISAILVAISAEELISQPIEVQRQHAFELQMKIRELQTLLGKFLPVYIIVTKLDRITGFTEFFSHISTEEKKKVFGISFDVSDNAKINFERDFNIWIAKINDSALQKAQQENNALNAALITGFPLQLIFLKEKITSRLETLFSVTRFHEPLQLRGIYFSSAEQNREITVDPLLGSMASQFSLSDNRDDSQESHSDSYFIDELLQQLILRDANLNLPTHEYVQKKRKQKQRYYYGLTAILLAFTSLGAVGYMTNQHVIRQLNNILGQYQKAYQPVQGNTIEDLQRLDNTRAAIIEPRYLALRYLGFHQALNLNSKIHIFYQQQLADIMLPWITADVHQEVFNSLNQPGILYQDLKMYLMLGYPEHFDANFERQWLQDYWQKKYMNSPRDQATLMQLLEVILKLPPRAMPVDLNLISQARANLNQLSSAERIYADIQQKALGKNLKPIIFTHNTVFNTQSSVITIPGFYTAEGYRQYYLREISSLSTKFKTDDWVVGNNNREIQLLPQTVKKVQDLYQKDYNQNWMKSLTALSINTESSLPDLVGLLKDLSQKNSDLENVIKKTQQNTDNLIGINPIFSKTDYLSIQKTLTQVYQFVLPFSETQDGGASVYQFINSQSDTSKHTPLNTLQDEALQSAEPLKTWLNSIVVEIYKVLDANAVNYANGDWQKNVVQNYTQAIAGRYPFNVNSPNDVALADFSRFFAPNGVLDQFYQTHQAILPFSNTALENKQSASLIQQAFFSSGGSALSAPMTIEAVNLDADIVSAQLTIGDQTIMYRHDPQLPHTINWPVTANDGRVSLTLIDATGKRYEVTKNGAWGLFHLFDSCALDAQSQTVFDLNCAIDNHHVTYHIEATSINNPFSVRNQLHNFVIPPTL